MKLDLSKTIKTIQGIEIASGSEPGSPPLTFGGAIIEALMTTQDNLTGKQSVERYDLAIRINESVIVELTTSELATIQKCVEFRYGKAPLVLAPLFKILEGVSE